MPPRLTKCHCSISWLPTVILVSLWYLMVPSITTVSPGGHTGTLISIQYLMVAHSYPRDTTVAYSSLWWSNGILSTIILCHHSISWWLHCYPHVSRVSHGGSTVTIVSLQYLIVGSLVPKCHNRISCWLHWCPSATNTIVSLWYILVAPQVP